MRRGVVAIGALVACAFLAVLAGTGGTHGPSSERSSSAAHRTTVAGGGVLPDGSGAVVRRIPASQIRRPYEAHYEQGLFWVFDAGGPAMVAIDPRTGRIARHLRSPISD